MFVSHRQIAVSLLSAVVMCAGGVIIAKSDAVCAQSRSGGELCGNHAQSGNNGGDRQRNNNNPPQPLTCVLTPSASLLENGTTTVQLSWSPAADPGTVSLSRTHRTYRQLTPTGTSQYDDTFAVSAPSSVTYSLSYTHGGRSYMCSLGIETVLQITECNDNVDNSDSEDGLIDELDPGCHTDGNPTNGGTYTSTDDSESNPKPDLVSSISASASHIARRVDVSATARNQSSTYASTNSFIYGWRNIDAAASAPYCGFCFTHAGNTYGTIEQRNPTFTANQEITRNRHFTPSLPGHYQVCAVADSNNAISESSETNNAACLTVRLDDVNGTITTTVYTQPSLEANPSRVRKGSESLLTWDLGGRTECLVTGTNGQSFTVTTNGSQQTQSITSETTYTLSCPEDDTSDTATVKLIPQILEI